MISYFHHSFWKLPPRHGRALPTNSQTVLLQLGGWWLAGGPLQPNGALGCRWLGWRRSSNEPPWHSSVTSHPHPREMSPRMCSCGATAKSPASWARLSAFLACHLLAQECMMAPVHGAKCPWAQHAQELQVVHRIEPFLLLTGHFLQAKAKWAAPQSSSRGSMAMACGCHTAPRLM